MFKLSFKTDNSAFTEDEYGLNHETARILTEVARQIEQGNDTGNCRDDNGNKVGEWSLR